MSTTDHRSPDAPGLPPVARQMLALRSTVFAEWEARVRAALDRARAMPHPLLIDTLPAFYDSIVEALAPGYHNPAGINAGRLASEHGGERARMTDYDHEALIREYQVFRWVVFDVLQRAGVSLAPHESMTIHAVIDKGIEDAVTAFALVHAGLRERFAAALAHDLRGPLGSTSTALELILLLDDAQAIKATASRALANVRRMDDMIHELLTTMTFDSGEHIKLDVTRFNLLDVVAEVQSDHACATADCRVHAEGDTVSGWWDRAAMQRAVENLVQNAIKYGSAGSPVTIRIEEAYERVVLSVHNVGTPIPPEEQESIFQLYRRAVSAVHARTHGWGVGLPYVRAVAESHGGSIAVESSAERGTTFTLDVPKDCRPFAGAPTLASGKPA